MPSLKDRVSQALFSASLDSQTTAPGRQHLGQTPGRLIDHFILVLFHLPATGVLLKTGSRREFLPLLTTVKLAARLGKLVNGRKVARLVNEERSVAFS